MSWFAAPAELPVVLDAHGGALSREEGLANRGAYGHHDAPPARRWN